MQQFLQNVVDIHEHVKINTDDCDDEQSQWHIGMVKKRHLDGVRELIQTS